MSTVVITGIDTGIGRAVMQKFLTEGHTVIGTTFGEHHEATPGLIHFPFDLASPESIRFVTSAIIALGKKIDILINNAGAFCDKEETRVVTSKLRATLEVNLIGTIDFTEHLIPEIVRGGHIVNISSTAGSLDRAGRAESHLPYHYPSYKISKAALNMYTRTLALALRDDEITVSSLHPGWVRTEIGGGDAMLTPEEAAEYIYQFALSRPQSGEFWYKGENLPW